MKLFFIIARKTIIRRDRLCVNLKGMYRDLETNICIKTLYALMIFRHITDRKNFVRSPDVATVVHKSCVCISYL